MGSAAEVIEKKFVFCCVLRRYIMAAIGTIKTTFVSALSPLFGDEP
jgi:hypothetical protein